MIEITSPSGSRIWLALAAVAQVTEPGPGASAHGYSSVIRTFDGRVLEAREPASDIVAALNRARSAS